MRNTLRASSMPETIIQTSVNSFLVLGFLVSSCIFFEPCGDSPQPILLSPNEGDTIHAEYFSQSSLDTIYGKKFLKFKYYTNDIDPWPFGTRPVFFK